MAWNPSGAAQSGSTSVENHAPDGPPDAAAIAAMLAQFTLMMDSIRPRGRSSSISSKGSSPAQSLQGSRQSSPLPSPRGSMLRRTSVGGSSTANTRTPLNTVFSDGPIVEAPEIIGGDARGDSSSVPIQSPSSTSTTDSAASASTSANGATATDAPSPTDAATGQSTSLSMPRSNSGLLNPAVMRIRGIVPKLGGKKKTKDSQESAPEK
ncbi:hypothetical protein EIP91_008932 [Steccherinum ochraceum]|uniref:Uncharacterized protein n=1 Tax=Steccherinum ochraceum TaxID=92696 RepID=A0A4R0RRV9_9APHY|nr:hypothetical protein EIP91_008932 [Steccherinum ochraceum]